jgi:hypothetical protein
MSTTKYVFRSNRRDLLTGAAGLGAAVAMTVAAVPEEAEAHTPMRWKDPAWNRDAFARLQGNMDFGKVKHGWYSGAVCGVRDGEVVRPLMGFEGFSSTRLVDNGDGSYQKLLRETVYYTDLQTGEVMETFLNPYTNEEVRVVPVANDPFNIVIEKYYPQGPSYGGLREQEEERVPMLLPWKTTKPDTVTLATDIHLFYPSALQPDEWPRESSGKFVRVSEMFRYIIARADLEDERKTSIEYTGTWSRITPWLPWMLMGQAPGHIIYMGTMGGFDNLDMLSDKVRAYAEQNHPQYFEAPTEWEEPSLSSLEDYARTQKPAPVKK